MASTTSNDSALMWVSVILIIVGLLIILVKLRAESDYKIRGVGLIVAVIGLIMGVYVGYNSTQ